MRKVKLDDFHKGSLYCQATSAHYDKLVEDGYTHSHHDTKKSFIALNFIIVWGNRNMSHFMSEECYKTHTPEMEQIVLVDNEWYFTDKVYWYDIPTNFPALMYNNKTKGYFVIDRWKRGELFPIGKYEFIAPCDDVKRK